MRTVDVSLGVRSYPIFIGTNLLPTLGHKCAKVGLTGRCAVISDTNVARRYAKTAMAALKKSGFEPVLITVPPGETSKSLERVQTCCDQLARHRLERNSFIVALGGGVVGDLAGFVASIYLRGIDFVQAPTTLLAQVDSSVGGKVGVNLAAGKNLVGAFHQPRLVLCDLGALGTLPMRQIRSGLAEVIKCGIIRDEAFFSRLEKNLGKLLKRDPSALAETVARCCEIKAEVVAQDERDGGLRAILNFGHTIGHALEAISGYGKFLHGEAIAIGQVAAAKLSVKIMGLPPGEAQRIETVFRRAGLPASIQLSAKQEGRLLEAMRLDKKVSGGEIQFVLARRIGKAELGQKAPSELIANVLRKNGGVGNHC